MLSMSYTDNVDQIIANLTRLEKEQVPFALSKAINRVTFEARDEVLAKMDRRFTIRENSLKAKGGGRRALFVNASNKKQSSIRAEIGTPFWFMEDQEEGGSRTGKSGHGAWLPGLGARTRKSKEGKVASRFKKAKVRKMIASTGAYPKGRRSKKNPKAFAKQQPFIATMKSGKRGVFIRQKRNSRLPISLLWTVTKSFRVAPRWRFREMIEGLSEKKLAAYFIADMQEALRTSRSGSKQSRYLEYLIGQRDLRAGERLLPVSQFGAGALSGNTLDQLSQVSRGLPGI
jgi:hypothetical protein